VPSSQILHVQGPPVRDPLAKTWIDGVRQDLQPAQQADPPSWRIEPLQGWHLPLLDDPAFLPLQPLLQRSLLLALPDRLLNTLRRRPPLVSEALVALQTLPGGQSCAIGLIVCRRLNRSGSSWQVEHLRLRLSATLQGQPCSRLEVGASLLREAIQRARSAASWIACASSLDSERLAMLRQLGFQPQRTVQVWRWRPTGSDTQPPLPVGLQLARLQRGNAAMLWHLEQAACPAPLRQLLDRRVEDLLDQSGDRGWLLIDTSRREAVAGLRWLADRPEGGPQLEFSLHPGWQHLLGAPCERLLRSFATAGQPLWISCEVGQTTCQGWLRKLGAEPLQEEVVMARSVWRRQERAAVNLPVRRLEAVLEQLQPRRRPLPSPIDGGVPLP
jgi:hypothetical protein